MDPQELAALLEQLSALDADERAAAIADIPAEHLDEVRDGLAERMVDLREQIQSGEGGQEALDALREGRTILDAVQERVTAAAADRESMVAEAAELTQDLEPPAGEEEDDDDESDDAETEADGDEAGEDAGEDGDDEDEDGDEVTASVTARSRLPKPGALNRVTPRPKRPAAAFAGNAPMALVASGDAEGFRAGHQFGDRLELAVAMTEMARAVKGSSHRRKYVVAKGGFEHPLQLSMDGMANFEVLSKLQREIDQDAEFDAIVAAGGFCAPETPYYGFFDVLAEDGIWTAPTLGAPRGSISVPLSPSFQDIVGTGDWDAATAQDWTESDDINVDPDDDSTWKVCYFVPCGTSSSFQVSAAVTCLEYGNFVQKFWPEMVADTSAKTLKAHTHKVNARNIAAAVAQVDATIAAVDLGDGGAIIQLLHNLEFHAQRQRDRFRAAVDARVQVDLPFWVQGALFNDAVARDSATTFERTLGWFTAVLNARNISVQWLQDWQSIQAATDYPAAVDALMYFPGTYVRLNEGSIDFGITRDTGSNRRNTFQQFMETFQGVAKVGHYAALIDNIPIYPTGGTGERVDLNGS